MAHSKHAAPQQQSIGQCCRPERQGCRSKWQQYPCHNGEQKYGIARFASLAADETLLFAVNSPSFFPSVTAAQALAESLLEVLVSRAGPEAVARIEAAEGELHDSGVYVQAPRR